MKKILLAYESARRELDYLIVLKNSLEARGYRCELACVYFNLVSMIYSFVPHILVMPWTRSDSVYFKAALDVNKNMIIIDTHAEQLLDAEQAEYVLGRHSKKVADYHLVWGPHFRDRWLGDVNDNVYVVGNMRMDLYGPPYDRLFSSDLKQHWGLEGKRIILFISSFGGVFYPEESVTLHEKTFKNIRNEISEAKRQIAAISGFVAEFLSANRYPDLMFVIRPHPTDNVTGLRKYFPKSERLGIIASGGIHEWIVNADAVFSCISTAILDSYMMAKPSWIVETEGATHNKASHMRFAKAVNNFQDFKGAIEAALAGEYDPSLYWHRTELEKYVADNYGIIDGRSFDRMVQAIDDICRRGKTLKNINIQNVQAFDIVKSRLKEKIKTTLADKHILGLTKRWSVLQKEYVTRDEMDRRGESFKTILSNVRRSSLKTTPTQIV
ncbi:MAG: hypothetical protein K8I29_06300 [Alphaproteobacteria bacterium]|uniref:Surface carbohydrate biosynthesis protein n=1 Tax=Candidatus Nitrobium versatile TaxID=2884831 RepID=A0A953J553_9BACT|nr:hypothetical protein [Candidatus Nitrobium versatile]